MLLPVFALFSRAGEYGIYDIENYKNAFPEQATEYASPNEIASGEMTTSSLLDIIKKITGKDEVRQHLAELGFVVGETVTVVNEISGNLILQVKEARIALDKTLAMRIIVA